MTKIDLYYQDIKKQSGEPIEIRDRFEICQGGPEFGTLYVNNKKLFEKDIFTGPMVEYENTLYLVRRKKSFFSFKSFQLCAIDLSLESVSELDSASEFIQIDKVKSGVLNYHVADLNTDWKSRSLRLEKNSGNGGGHE